MRSFRPDKVLTYTVKCNVYGALAAKSLKIPHFCSITALGTPFYEGGIKGLVVSALYRISLNKADTVFFENVGDRDIIVNRKDACYHVVLPFSVLYENAEAAELFPCLCVYRSRLHDALRSYCACSYISYIYCMYSTPADGQH